MDAEGPLTRLKNLIFDPATLETISDWIVVCKRLSLHSSIKRKYAFLPMLKTTIQNDIDIA